MYRLKSKRAVVMVAAAWVPIEAKCIGTGCFPTKVSSFIYLFLSSFVTSNNARAVMLLLCLIFFFTHSRNVLRVRHVICIYCVICSKTFFSDAYPSPNVYNQQRTSKHAHRHGVLMECIGTYIFCGIFVSILL